MKDQDDIEAESREMRATAHRILLKDDTAGTPLQPMESIAVCPTCSYVWESPGNRGVVHEMWEEMFNNKFGKFKGIKPIRKGRVESFDETDIKAFIRQVIRIIHE